MGSVSVAGLLLGVIALVTLSLLNSTYQQAIVVGEAAQLTAAVEASTDYVALLLETERRPGGNTAFTPVTAARVYEQIKFQQDASLRLTEIVDSPEVDRLRQLMEAQEVAFLRLAESGDLVDFTAIHNIHLELHDLAETLESSLRTSAFAHGEHASKFAFRAGVAVVAAVAVVLALLSTTTWLISRRWSLILERSEHERASLAASTVSIERRNAQFRALYQAAAETTDEIEVEKVAEGAVSAAIKLLEAELTVLWLAGDDALTIAAVNAVSSWQDDDALPSDPAVPRRVAGRGRSLIMGPGELADIADVGVQGALAGVMAPIIASSQIVGVIGAWSRTANAFDDDDRRLLEMLAAQVAPAIAAGASYAVSEERASRDALTGARNRHQLTDDIAASYAQTLAARGSITAAMLDLDHFKLFNDNYGHATGDLALKLVSRILVEHLRVEDRVYRLGGDEFLVVLDDVSAPEAERILRGILAKVSSASRDELDLPVPVGVSAGIAVSGELDLDFARLLERADSALYEAKALGRGRLIAWHAGTTAAEAA